MLRRELKKDIPYPKGMATDEEFKKQLQDMGDKPAKVKKARGGGTQGEDGKGGMANGKAHMYGRRGCHTMPTTYVSGSKGMQAYNKITGKQWPRSPKEKMAVGAITRNYKKYANYHAKPAQKQNRASRNAARSTLKQAGVNVAGKDAAHRNGNPKDIVENLTVKTALKTGHT